jgi:hypothetical protein
MPHIENGGPMGAVMEEERFRDDGYSGGSGYWIGQIRMSV